MQTLKHIQYESSNSYPSDITIPDGYFLNDSIPFNYRLYTPLLGEYTKWLFPQIYRGNRIKKRSHKLLALNSIISNILTAHYNNKCLAISKNRNTYIIGHMYGMNHYSYTSIITHTNCLIYTERLNVAPGFYDSKNCRGKNSRIWATPKLIEEVEGFILNEISICSIERLTYHLKYDTPIVLKKDKRMVDFRPNEKTKRMKNFLEDYNSFITSQDIIIPFEVDLKKDEKQKSAFCISEYIQSMFEANSTKYSPDTYYNVHIPYNIYILSNINSSYTPLLRYNDTNYLQYKGLNTQLYRVFNDSFKFGGRFYGGDYQGFPENMRNQILINGEKNVELDYSSYHFMMLYHLAGMDYKTDPYLAVNDNPELRPLLKLLCNIIINSGSKRKAVGGFNHEVYYKDPKKSRGKRKFYKEMIEKYHLSFEELYNQFTETHKPLEKHFLSGVGLKLQNIDSFIAEKVMVHFLSKGIPILCIHDSFIVPEKHNDELEGVMKETYKSKFKYDIHVK